MSHDWMRSDKVNILKYLPSFLNKDKQFQAANDADSEEHDTVRILLHDLLDQCYVSTATWGLSLWEELVGLEVPSADNYESRRANVEVLLRSNQSVTKKFLETILSKFVSGGSVNVIDIPSNYQIQVDVDVKTSLDWQALLKALRVWIPAHIGYLTDFRLTADVEHRFGGVIGNHREFMISQQVSDNVVLDATQNYAGVQATVREMVIRQEIG